MTARKLRKTVEMQTVWAPSRFFVPKLVELL